MVHVKIEDKISKTQNNPSGLREFPSSSSIIEFVREQGGRWIIEQSSGSDKYSWKLEKLSV